MSHNAPHGSIEDLATEILGTKGWGQSERVAFALETNQTLEQVDDSLRSHFFERQLTDEQRAALEGAPFMK